MGWPSLATNACAGDSRARSAINTPNDPTVMAARSGRSFGRAISGIDRRAVSGYYTGSHRIVA